MLDAEKPPGFCFLKNASGATKRLGDESVGRKRGLEEQTDGRSRCSFKFLVLSEWFLSNGSGLVYLDQRSGC